MTEKLLTDIEHQNKQTFIKVPDNFYTDALVGLLCIIRQVLNHGTAFLTRCRWFNTCTSCHRSSQFFINISVGFSIPQTNTTTLLLRAADGSWLEGPGGEFDGTYSMTCTLAACVTTAIPSGEHGTEVATLLDIKLFITNHYPHHQSSESWLHGAPKLRVLAKWVPDTTASLVHSQQINGHHRRFHCY